MILLTGATGYLGRHVLMLLKARQAPHLACSRHGWANDFIARIDLNKRFEITGDVTSIIHCAAIVPKTERDYHDVDACEDNQDMMVRLMNASPCPMIFVSSQVAADPQSSRYALGKWICERWLQMRERPGDVILRLPGLFGLPRRSGVIYESALKGEVRESYGPYPAMHVEDVAEYLVRAATMPSDGHPEAFSVTYGNARLEAVYGSLGVTFQQRVQQFVEQLRAEVNA